MFSSSVSLLWWLATLRCISTSQSWKNKQHCHQHRSTCWSPAVGLRVTLWQICCPSGFQASSWKGSRPYCISRPLFQCLLAFAPVRKSRSSWGLRDACAPPASELVHFCIPTGLTLSQAWISGFTCTYSLHGFHAQCTVANEGLRRLPFPYPCLVFRESLRAGPQNQGNRANQIPVGHCTVAVVDKLQRGGPATLDCGKEETPAQEAAQV